MQLRRQCLQRKSRGDRLDIGRLRVHPDPIDGTDERVKVVRDGAFVPGGQQQARVVGDKDTSVHHGVLGDDEHAVAA